MKGHLVRSWCRVLASATLAAGSIASGPALGAQRAVAATSNAADDTRAAKEVLSRRVTVTLTNVSRATAIKRISQMAHVFVAYHVKMLEAYPGVISVHATALPLGAVLEQVLDGTGLRVISDGQGGLMVTSADDTVAGGSVLAVGTVTGRVVDSASGRGLDGATIKVKGTKLSALTTDSGRFVLRDVPAGNQALEVRRFGYRLTTQVVAVTDGESVNVRVVMVPVPTMLSGVVTTATGTRRKVEVGNDITTLNVDSIRQIAPITSVTSLLESRVPGLTVIHTSGVPGDPARLRLRGASSISGNNDPIVIVDGVRVYAAQSDARNANLANSDLASFAAPSPLDQIDPNSIETIEVQKGPSASSLYGSDAASGVIIITTKKGRAGPAHWNAIVESGLTFMPGEWPVNYFRFGYGPLSSVQGKDQYLCAWNDPSCVVDSVVKFQALNQQRYTVFADHGSDNRGTLTVSGGTPGLTYSLTGSGSRAVGIFKLPGLEEERYKKFYSTSVPGWMRRPSQYTTYGGTGVLAAQPRSTLQVGMSSSLFYGMQRRSSLEGAVGQLQRQYIYSDQLESGQLISGEFVKATDEQLTWTNAATLNWQPRAWLPISATGGINAITRTDETLLPYGINSKTAGDINGDTTGDYSIGRGSSLVKTLTVGTTIPLARARLNTAIGFNMTSQSTADVKAHTSTLSPGITRPTNFVPLSSEFSQGGEASSTYGWYFEPRLNIASRFFASPGFRLDGGSGSGARGGFLGNGLAGFPKLDLSYVLVDRQEGRPLGGVVSFFRPRVAYGYAGTQPSPDWKLRLYAPPSSDDSLAGTLDGVTVINPLYLTNIGNTHLQPERASQLEGGFDLQLWDNRLELTATGYDKVKRDAIISVPVPASVGGTLRSDASQWVNFGVVRNRGAELMLTAQLLEARNLAWNVSTSWSQNNNRVVRLRADFNPSSITGLEITSGSRIVVGYPLDGRWARPIVAYADVNHNKVIEQNEVQLGDSVVFVGGVDPKYHSTFGTNVLLWGRLSMTAAAEYTRGLNQLNAGAATESAFASLLNTPGTTLATQAAVVAAFGARTDGRGGSNIGLIQTVNTLRFNTLSVNYVLPLVVARQFHVPHATLALQGSNLGLWSNYRGKDPNVNAFSTGNGVQDTGQLPQSRLWRLQLTLSN